MICVEAPEPYIQQAGDGPSMSTRFAQGASGEVHAFITGMRGEADFAQKTYMKIERPILAENPNVTKLVEHE